MIIFALIVFFWGWSYLGKSPNSHLSPLLKSHHNAASWGYLGALTMLLTSWFASSFLMTRSAYESYSMMGGAFFVIWALLTYSLYLKLDKHKKGIWHHRRVRPFMIALSIIVALVGLSLRMNWPYISLFLAVAIFHRQQKHVRRLLNELFLNQEILRKKIISLEADLSQSKAVLETDLSRISTKDPLIPTYRLSS
jgi:hypothetical protein